MAYLLTIDPGSNIGYAVYPTDRCVVPLDYGLIDGGKHSTRYDKANYIEDQLEMLFSKWKPQELVVEDVTCIVQKHADANFWLNYTFGFVTSIASRRGMDVSTIHPATLKATVRRAGLLSQEQLDKYCKKGRFQKQGVVLSMNKLFNLSLKMKDDDIADALALGAITLELI